MKRTLEDLRGALQDEAEGTAYPDVQALVSGAGRRVVAVRRRRLAALGAATATVLAIGAALAGSMDSTHKAVPQPAGPGPFSVSAGGAGFAKYDQGLKLLSVVDAPMLEHVKGSFSLPTTPGRRLFLSMTCTPAGDVDEWNRIVDATFTGPNRTTKALCALPDLPGQGQESIGIAMTAKTTVLADVLVNHQSGSTSGPSFKNAKVHVAVYESVPWQDYPFPARPAGPVEPGAAWVDEPGTLKVVGPKAVGTANSPITFVQPYGDDIRLILSVRGPGRMRILIDGKEFVSSQLEQRGQGLLSYWGYDSRSLSFPLIVGPNPFGDVPKGGRPAGPVATPMPIKLGTPVTVTILPQDFQGADWQLKVLKSTTGG